MRKFWALLACVVSLGIGHIACRPVKVKSNLDADGSSAQASPVPQSYDASTPAEPATCPGASLRVIGGQPVAAMSLLAAGSVKVWTKGQRFCSGTLIGPQHIVTAAHCFREPIRVEDLRIGFGIDGEPDPNVRVLAYHIHPAYKGIPNQVTPVPEVPLYDVAVILFQGTLPEVMRPVPLAKPSFLAPGLSVLVAGYGAYASADREHRPLSSVAIKIDQIFPDQRELQLQRGEAKGACFGDSGGPTYLAGDGGACLFLVGSTTGPGRNTKGTCESGGGTLMDLTRYQGWMSCAYKAMGAPLLTLAQDASGDDCS